MQTDCLQYHEQERKCVVSLATFSCNGTSLCKNLSRTSLHDLSSYGLLPNDHLSHSSIGSCVTILVVCGRVGPGNKANYVLTC